MRLIDLTINEVSLVDKGANKKKFAFMKRETEVTPEVKAEVKEAAQIIKETEVKPEAFTPEQLSQMAAFNVEIIELVAQLKTQNK